MWICIQQLEKARVSFHKTCQREATALDKEKQANENTEMSPEKKQKFTNTREKVTEEKEKVRRGFNSTVLSHASFTFPNSHHAIEINLKFPWSLFVLKHVVIFIQLRNYQL